MQITMLYGGQSAEHEISILSAFNICQAIDYTTHSVQPIYITKEGRWIKGLILNQAPYYADQLYLEAAELASWAPDESQRSTGVWMNPGDIQSTHTVVFPVLHGPNGEDGTIQGFLEVMQMPYVGAGVLASACGMDKMICKQLFQQASLPQVPYVAFDRRQWEQETDALVQKIEGSLLYPIFVKPANMGSSVGISRVEDEGALRQAIVQALAYDSRIVVEQGIDADECEVAILGNEDVHASVVGRLLKSQSFYDYDEKYVNNTVEMEIPAQLSEGVSLKIQEYAIKAYRLIGGSGLSRVDFFVTSNEDVYINEINTMPGFTNYSMYPSLWRETGIGTEDLIEELIQLALVRFENRSKHALD